MINIDCESKTEPASCKFFDLINEVTSATKLNETDAAQAVQVVLGFLESKLPTSVTDQIFAIFAQD